MKANSTDPVIVLNDVWKQYTRTEYRPSLRQEAKVLMQRLLRRAVQGGSQPFYALKDVSFTVRRGEAVGIIGRNGSGKTTLLRLLSGITRPTRGSLQVNGHFATLIGLNAGFDSERTGRENTYLNAAIQGVPPSRVNEILDDIITFGELGPFIDTPVKFYSSGMVARLGFSIAVHILPEIIFLDEVLAVGDSAFQEKCIERIMLLKSQGRTLLFVSHAMGQVEMLCERTLWLHDGQLMQDGPTEAVLAQYDDAF